MKATSTITSEAIGRALKKAGVPKRVAPRAQYNVNDCEIQSMGSGAGYSIGHHTPGFAIAVHVYGRQHTLADIEAILKAAGLDAEKHDNCVWVE